MNRLDTLPTKGDLKFAYRASLVVAMLMVLASTAGILLGTTGLYGKDPRLGLGATEAEAGLLIPGLLGQDLFNLAVGVPILLGAMWFTRRGSLIGLLLWPGALFYALYWYLLYLVGAPFSVLFLLYVALVTLSAYATISLVSHIDGEQVQRQLTGSVPTRIAGGILVGLALLTLAQDTGGAFVTALSGSVPIDPAARHVWIADLVLDAPAVLVGGVLLWRRRPLGYLAGAGLLLQYGLTPVGLAVGLALQAMLTTSALPVATSAALLVFAVVCFTTLALFVRGAANAAGRERRMAPPVIGSHIRPS
jgi:hypothetical protein